MRCESRGQIGRAGATTRGDKGRLRLLLLLLLAAATAGSDDEARAGAGTALLSSAKAALHLSREEAPGGMASLIALVEVQTVAFASWA